ncbi:unnamed protein product [Mytilus coruscus]|uniref:Mab-21-like HhH/H2TH-like domain-containing protein n=1 Tax=Mytilus coruscus TaxID=42192 RepID=A0A6J8ETN5_MYTCO|nr:unnamed protein product [Mytilus coruscus]
MSADNSLSFHIYKYLCQKIGSEEDVKAMRFAYIIDDLAIQCGTFNKIISGSKGEGLQLKGSDHDVMCIDPFFKVYESNEDVVPHSGQCIPLAMDTEDTYPCFTQLRLLNNHELIFIPTERINNTFLGRKLSSELYKLFRMEDMSNTVGKGLTSTYKVHGPCITNLTGTYDFAWCLKCDQWISEAQSWIIRPRITWPSPDLISKIISCDAVSGWLLLASFFYVHENYLLSLDIINHALRKCTNEKMYPWHIGLNQTQEYLLQLMKQTELCTLSKAITIKYPNVYNNSPVCPTELQLNVTKQAIPFHPMIFAYFLSFLCYYHLTKRRSCKQSLPQLRQEIIKHFTTNLCNLYSEPLFITCLGIAHQMLGETHIARQCFREASQKDEHHVTSAAIRLANL